MLTHACDGKTLQEQHQLRSKHSSDKEEYVIQWTPKQYFSTSAYLMNFADTTSCHGLNRCAAHKGLKKKSLRCVWILLSVLAFACFNVHLGYLVKYYIGKPTTTSVYVTGIPFRYPTVTVCNRKLLSVSYTRNYDYKLYRWHTHSKTSWERLQLYSENLRKSLAYLTGVCYLCLWAKTMEYLHVIDCIK